MPSAAIEAVVVGIVSVVGLLVIAICNVQKIRPMAINPQGVVDD